MLSRYETNLLNQPSEWKRLLATPLPSDLNNLKPERIILVGIGTSYWAARFAEFLWREYANLDVISVQSFDFVRSNYSLSCNDAVVVFSHRGTKTFSVLALDKAKRSGTTTVLITGIGSPNHNADIRIETCVQENCGAFTISLTSALVRIIQWLGLFNTDLLKIFEYTLENFDISSEITLPRFPNNLVIIGDVIREVVAREVCLKISETTYLHARSFGLEEFLHGPRVTLDTTSSLLAFTSTNELRRESVFAYVKDIGSEIINIDERVFSLPKEFVWLGQLVWGQRLALELSKELKTNPDNVRGDQAPYSEARKKLTL